MVRKFCLEKAVFKNKNVAVPAPRVSPGTARVLTLALSPWGRCVVDASRTSLCGRHRLVYEAVGLGFGWGESGETCENVLRVSSVLRVPPGSSPEQDMDSGDSNRLVSSPLRTHTC